MSRASGSKGHHGKIGKRLKTNQTVLLLDEAFLMSAQGMT
jgi:hypothetical protein